MRRALFALALAGVVLYGAHAYRSARPVAPTSTPVEAAWAAVHAAPSDAAAWIVLGDAESAADEMAAAEHAYRTALRLDPEDVTAKVRLGFALYARGADTEARALLLEAKQRGADAPMLDTTLAALEPVAARATPTVRAPPPDDAEVPDVPDAGTVVDASVVREPKPAPRERVAAAPVEEAPARSFDASCELPLTRLRGGGTYGIDVVVDGVEARLLLDTGASITVITSELADLIGLARDPHRRVRAITANGRVEMAMGDVEGVEVAGRRVAATSVAICEGCVEGLADGLFGLDLVAAFGMTLDVSEDLVRFADCRR